MTRKPAKKRKSSRPKPATVPRIIWGTGASITGFFDRDGMRFAIVIQHVPSEWHVLGLVTRLPEWGSNDSQMMQDVLAHHAHEQLGSFGSLDGEGSAMDRARRFLLEAPVPASLCACTDVGFAAAGPDP